MAIYNSSMNCIALCNPRTANLLSVYVENHYINLHKRNTICNAGLPFQEDQRRTAENLRVSDTAVAETCMKVNFIT